MIPRALVPPKSASFFLLGPRGTGKSTWLRSAFPDATVFDLLEPALFSELLRHPERLAPMIDARRSKTVVIDEVQRLPQLLDEVHRLIETAAVRFVLTGSSARKLRRSGTNLLAGRARTLTMHPLTATELGARFSVQHSLRFGQLPTAYVADDPAAYLSAYAGTYLREEVQAEALTRNVEGFARFLTAASFSQAAALNISAIARELGVARKTVESHFQLLEDLLLSVRLPVFTRRARRELQAHPRFFLFDAGVYRALRPRGPLDSDEELNGAGLETLVMQELRAHNDNHGLGYTLSYWRTRRDEEVDFVLYGERGLKAFEVKLTSTFRESDLSHLRLFLDDYPQANGWYLYGGTQRYRFGRLEVLPVGEALASLGELL